MEDLNSPTLAEATPVPTVGSGGGQGFASWRRGILIALSAKNKLGFIDGSISEPKISSESYKPWSRCNDMISELTQGNLDIAAYYTRLKRLWDELDSLDTCFLCTCDFSCGGKQKTSKSQQDSRLIQFLMGLTDAYSGPRSNLLMISPLPSVNLAYSLLIRDEKQREVQVHGQQSEATFFSAKQQFTAPRSYPEKRVFTDHNKGSLFCTYCKKKNHVVDNCYRLIGFPADFKFTKSKKFGTTARSNAALSTEEGDSQSNNSGDKAMTQDQYLNLCQLLQHVKIGSQGELVPSDNVIANCAGISDTFPYTNSYLSVSIGHISWILDSGASDHITSDPTLLFNIQTLSKPILINLPNLLNVKVFQTGSVTILPDYTLHHVLFVPSFKYNLLSVHKLCAQFNSIMIFSSLHAILQAPSMKRPLVLGRVSKGLYLLHASKQIKPRAQDLSSNRISAFSLCTQLINQCSKFVLVLANVNSDRSKLDPRSLKCVFLGYTFGKKGYKVLDLNSKKILTSRDVVFHETIFPFSSDTRPVSTDYPLPYFTPFHFPTDFGHSDSLSPTSPSSSPSSTNPIDHIVSPPPTPVHSSAPITVPSTTPIPIPLRMSTRSHQIPKHLADYVCNSIVLTDLTDSCFASPISPQTVSFTALSHSNQSLLTSTSYISEPTSYSQASLHPGWQNAMAEELVALKSNNTWDCGFTFA
ncbi:hypothetical protein EJD97_005847 [Solanum chilense]|uniref:Uncharacterized protein n=1 Tax=Solanum chilense TaxID=4083 RepID=A0A6N2AIW5_SOLCI|nr:hypothetical protein EJD97_005847 [Solanum chilense]